ncbi:hypothetical protein SH668x_001085 [Planctomicrobium sp. SH668]|uniref:hypothetical protein n=1 Tax=Planctomicrobium sp. SH668 TaxID=3448126 RepID=UPI003F5B77ED
MHILGKVLLWLCVFPLIPAALVLTTMTLEVRHKWLKDVADRQSRVEKGLVQIADAEKRVRALEEQRQALVQAWGDVWNATNSIVQPGNAGIVELGVGASSGLPQRAADATTDPAIFVFADGQGQSQYLGEFTIGSIRPNHTVARLARAPFQNEIGTWPSGLYHARATLPGDLLVSIADLEGQERIAEASLADSLQQLEVQKKLVIAAQATLDQRLAELNGNPDAPETALPDVKDGLIATLTLAEEVRDDTLLIVDHLRVILAEKYTELRATLIENQDLAKALSENSSSQKLPESPATAQN